MALLISISKPITPSLTIVTGLKLRLPSATSVYACNIFINMKQCLREFSMQNGCKDHVWSKCSGTISKLFHIMDTPLSSILFADKAILHIIDMLPSGFVMLFACIFISWIHCKEVSYLLYLQCSVTSGAYSYKQRT